LGLRTADMILTLLGRTLPIATGAPIMADCTRASCRRSRRSFCRRLPTDFASVPSAAEQPLWTQRRYSTRPFHGRSVEVQPNALEVPIWELCRLSTASRPCARRSNPHPTLSQASRSSLTHQPRRPPPPVSAPSNRRPSPRRLPISCHHQPPPPRSTRFPRSLLQTLVSRPTAILR
jgi:hypothetical protein